MLSTIPDKNRRTLRGNMDDQKSDILRSQYRGIPSLGHSPKNVVLFWERGLLIYDYIIIMII